MQVFPLAADPSALQHLCDELFNDVVPTSVAHFRPALPLVLCTVLHYPEMAGDLPWRSGTLSQNEIYFLVMLERLRKVNGRWQFVEYAATTPYILVDSAESAVAGRERFGMPKQDAVFTGRDPQLPWPPEPQPYLSVSAYNPTPAGHRLDPLLEVLRQPRRLPDLAFSEGSAVGRSPAAPASQLGNLLWLSRALSRASAHGRPPHTWVRSLAGLLQMAAGEGTLPVYSLRQFGDPEYRDAARYQDLVSFRAQVADLQRVGMFATPTELRLHRTQVRPIADRLGLRVSRRERTETPDGEGSVDVLEPLAAFYAQSDLELVEASRLCWRGAVTPWHGADGRPLGPAVSGLRSRYNRSLGPSAAAFLEERGPRPILDFRFLMMAAHRDCVVDLIARKLPAGAPIEIEPLAVGNVSAIRIAAYRSRPRAPSDQEELQWLDGQYLSVSVPIRLRAHGREGTGLFLLRDFTDNSFMVQAIRELALAPTSAAQFTDVDDWFSAVRPVAPLLSVSAPALHRTAVGAKVVSQPVLDVFAVSGPKARHELPIGIRRAELDGVVAGLWPHVFGIFPIVSTGRIDAPAGVGSPVSRRVLLTHFEDFALADGAYVHPPNVAHLLRLHDSETFPVWGKLGLRTLPDQARLEHELRRGVTGRSWIVPAIAHGEASYRINISRMKVLWESYAMGRGHR